MAWLTATDPLPGVPRRVVLAAGNEARRAGLARRLAAELGLPRSAAVPGAAIPAAGMPKPDAVHGPLGSAWLREWPARSGDSIPPALARAADTLVWLDLSSSVLRRVLGRRSDDREPGAAAAVAEQVRAMAADRPELVVVRLRSARQLRRWLRGAVRARRPTPR